MNKSYETGSFEQVLDQWDYYDGPREGVAFFRGNPCHFYNSFDISLGDFPSEFIIKLVDDTFVKLSSKRTAIFDAWRIKFDLGEVELNTHPEGPGIDLEYDELSHNLEEALKKFAPLSSKYIPTFRPLKSKGKMEVLWSDT